MASFFKDLDVRDWSGKTIILDIDGTLTADGQLECEEAVSRKTRELAENNSVFLCSNARIPVRNQALAAYLSLPFLESPYKKPSKKLVDALPEYLRKNFVVIGDKTLTDGIFASRIGAQFVKVKRILGSKDSVFTRLAYLLDDTISLLLGN